MPRKLDDTLIAEGITRNQQSPIFIVFASRGGSDTVSDM